MRLRHAISNHCQNGAPFCLQKTRTIVMRTLWGLRPIAECSMYSSAKELAWVGSGTAPLARVFSLRRELAQLSLSFAA